MALTLIRQKLRDIGIDEQYINTLIAYAVSRGDIDALLSKIENLYKGVTQ